MDSVLIKAFGKVNLALNVGDTRPDGFHEVAMILQSVDLYDEIELTKADTEKVKILVDPAIQKSMGGETLPVDEGNLAVKAMRLMQERFHLPKVQLRLVKHIPIAAGMAGGSTDAAGVLKGMNELFSLGLSTKDLCTLAAELGSDVPFCVQGGCCLAEGRGEILTPIQGLKEVPLVLIKPDFGISTPWSYRSFSPENNPQADITALVEALAAAAGEEAIRKEAVVGHEDAAAKEEKAKENLIRAISLMQNQLAKAALEAHPVIETLLKDLLEEGALGAIMTGSGPTVFGIFDSMEQAKTAARSLQTKLPISYCTLTAKTV